jgi:hypothetical protein
VRKIFITSLIIVLYCTNPFDTRDPHPPQIVNPIQPVSNLQNDPDSLLKLLQIAFQEPNWNYYETLLVDPARFGLNFWFVPQTDVAYRLQGWTRQDELNYFRKLVQERSRDDLMLQIYNIQGPVQIGTSQDTVQTQFSYQIEIKHLNNKRYYKGQSIFKIFRSQQSLWYIFYWEDLKPNTGQADSTWSILKADFR